MIAWGWKSLLGMGKSPAVEEKPTKKDDGYIDEPPEVILSDAVRVSRYVEDGGAVVDLTNKPRIKGDGFPPDQDLLHPWNKAHEGMKEGLMRGGKS